MKNDVKSSKVKVTSLEVAWQYIESMPLGEDRVACENILHAIQRGALHSAISSAKSIARPEFGPDRYFLLKQFAALVTKVVYPGSDTQQAAMETFLADERRNRRTNKRLRHFQVHPDRVPRDVMLAITRARSFLAHHLGLFDERKYDRILALSRPGPGVTQGTWNRYRTSPVYKYTASDYTLHEDCLGVIRDLEVRTGFSRWYTEINGSRPLLRFATSSKVGFVPKDSLTSRTIATEPNLNMLLQLGTHEFLADRLKRIGGCDISDQSLNQALARFGSTVFGISTLDLSSASDSVTIELVRWLLPPSWFLWLSTIRCPSVNLRGVEMVSEKFSTMGNGATFALETLIFKALSHGCNSLVRGTTFSAVFGDDIIVPSSSAGLLTEVLRFCGFRVNLGKSFVFGPFRESCGADWHSGRDVTPVYVRSFDVDQMAFHRLINTWREPSTKRRMRRKLLRLYERFPTPYFGVACDETGSCVFVKNLRTLQKLGVGRWKPDYCNYEFRALREKGYTDSAASVGIRYLAALMGGKPDLRGLTKVKSCWLVVGGTVAAPYHLRRKAKSGKLST